MSEKYDALAARIGVLEQIAVAHLPPLECMESTHGESGNDPCGRLATTRVDTGIGYMHLCHRCAGYYVGERQPITAADRLSWEGERA
jgi:hypothetical protein